MVPPNNASKWQMGFNSAFKGLISRSKAGGRVKEICQPKCTRTCSGQTLFLDAREAGGLGWNDARGPIKGQPSYVINETMISPGRENNAYHSPTRRSRPSTTLKNKHSHISEN